MISKIHCFFLAQFSQKLNQEKVKLTEVLKFCSHLLFCSYEEKPKLPTNFEEETWAKLKSAITAIFLKQPDYCDLEKLYQVRGLEPIACILVYYLSQDKMLVRMFYLRLDLFQEVLNVVYRL